MAVITTCKHSKSPVGLICREEGEGAERGKRDLQILKEMIVKLDEVLIKREYIFLNLQ